MNDILVVTFCGNSETLIREALLSVAPLVDRCLLIDTGIRDRTLEIARELLGERLIVETWAWRNDFAAGWHC